MKRMKMETKIAITVLIMFIVGVVINGIYSVVSMNSNFLTLSVLERGIMYALIYLFYVWTSTRRHKLLTLTGLLCILCVMIFIVLFNLDANNIAVIWDYRDTIQLIVYTASAIIADYQGEKLLEEDNEKIKSDQRALIREEIENAKREEH